MIIEKITYKDAVDFLLPRHYSGRKPTISFAYGVFIDGVLVAVCTFGKPASNALCEGVCGKEYKDKVFELNRLCVDDGVDISLSKFVSFCLRDLKSLNLILISYADTAMNHVGYIYQATNWIYTGATKSRTDKYTPDGKHSRHYTNEFNHLRKVRSSKHRYIYFTCDKRTKNKYLKLLNYSILPYPKGDNKRYKLGEFKKDTIIENNEQYNTRQI